MQEQCKSTNGVVHLGGTPSQGANTVCGLPSLGEHRIPPTARASVRRLRRGRECDVQPGVRLFA